MAEHDDALEAAVDDFLDDAAAALDEYDDGYADADATLRRLRAQIATLRETRED